MTALDPDLFMPEPLPREVKYTVISVDDHVVEPAHLFSRYLPQKLQSGGPQIVETDNGAEVWEFEGQIFSQVGMNAIAGRRKDTVKLEPFRFEHMRPGCYDIEARVRDMDIGGIWASVNFLPMDRPHRCCETRHQARKHTPFGQAGPIKRRHGEMSA